MFKILLIILFYSILINKLTIAINDENSKDSSINEEDPFYLKFKNMEKLMNALNFKKNNKINNDKMTTSTTMEIKTSSTNTTTKTTKLLTTTLLTTTNKIPTTTETTTNTSSSTTTDKPTNYIYIKSVGWMVVAIIFIVLAILQFIALFIIIYNRKRCGFGDTQGLVSI